MSYLEHNETGQCRGPMRTWRRLSIPVLPRLPAAFGMFLFAITVLSSPPTRAHPHAWIDVRTTVVLDDERKVTAFEQEWLFDPFYTAFATEGAVGRSNPTTDALTNLVGRYLQNLAEYQYFLDLRDDDEKLTLGRVTEFSSEIRESRLWMRFLVPLIRPVDPRSGGSSSGHMIRVTGLRCCTSKATSSRSAARGPPVAGHRSSVQRRRWRLLRSQQLWTGAPAAGMSLDCCLLRERRSHVIDD